ncbi:helix-turn-helix transcriptional regulator [Vaginella massiliensis]|uniref:helix-turn-helix transcriptional regulator n=1 Tax=Vaginella massiliensis TaxID=1816680 RepID=UPI00375278D7
MAKQDYIARYFNIITKLSRTPYCSYEELYKSLENEFEIYQLRDEKAIFNFSKRTFQRDIREIRNILGIDILYSRKHKGYYIVQDEFGSELFLKTVEQINSFHALKLMHSFEDIMHLEKTPPANVSFLPILIQAIQKNRKISFDYRKFGEDEISNRVASPLALKEYKNRWYVIAQENLQQKIFGLDRMLKVEILAAKRDQGIEFDYEDKFQHCFGIQVPNGDEPTKVVLEFNNKQAAYVRTLPWHNSQQLVFEDENVTRFEFTLFITDDFVSELLSWNDRVKVIKPKSLINQIKKKLQANLDLYS